MLCFSDALSGLYFWAQGSEQPRSISLVSERWRRPRPGEEIRISYGDKSNEELLMLYGMHIPG
jgi:hypothetical protein